MFCPTCGTQVRDGARFCPTCGASLDAAPAVTPQPTYEQPAQDPYAQQATGYPQDPYAQQDGYRGFSTVDGYRGVQPQGRPHHHHHHHGPGDPGDVLGSFFSPN